MGLVAKRQTPQQSVPTEIANVCLELMFTISQFLLLQFYLLQKPTLDTALPFILFYLLTVELVSGKMDVSNHISLKAGSVMPCQACH